MSAKVGGSSWQPPESFNFPPLFTFVLSIPTTTNDQSRQTTQTIALTPLSRRSPRPCLCFYQQSPTRPHDAREADPALDRPHSGMGACHLRPRPRCERSNNLYESFHRSLASSLHPFISSSLPDSILTKRRRERLVECRGAKDHRQGARGTGERRVVRQVTTKGVHLLAQARRLGDTDLRLGRRQRKHGQRLYSL